MSIAIRVVMLAALVSLVQGCSDAPSRPASGEQRAAGTWLSEAEAESRSSSISQLSYRLAIELETTPELFSGEAVLQFQYSGGDRPLTIDFYGGDIEQISINGEPARYDYNGVFISIRQGLLETGSNEIAITYSHPYSRDGTGLYRYLDPVDGKIYLYSNLEPWGANRIFPHFDQPDLKARFSLKVSAPSHWHVVSSVRESAAAPAGERRHWEFPESAPMSSYVFSLHAGDYMIWEDPEFRYPMRLMARQSLADKVDPQMWFDYTRHGFDFFDEYFNFPYPFAKYDQLLVPDFNHGAMENIAAVTFSERFVFRAAPTVLDRQSLAKTIYHEMAHMWFGDITTMKWWNGLWLNESFASLMAYLALQPQAEFPDPWLDFQLGFKRWAYIEDQLVTTHPIDLPVADTAAAENIFDGITYGKGAASLRQLNARLGPEVFQRGVQDYLQAHAWGNTTLDDFMTSLASAADTSLDSWTDQWLRESGVNGVQAKLQCRRGKISSLMLRQSAPGDYPLLRQHYLEVGLFDLQAAQLRLRTSIPVLMAGEQTPVSAAVGSPCPSLVYPNYRDLAYIKVSLDERALTVVRHHINSLQDPLQRALLWQDLWAMVTDQKLTLAQYLQILEANLAGETNLRLASSILGTLAESYSWLEMMAGGFAELQRSARVTEPLLWRAVTSNAGDAHRTWLNAYISTARNPASLQRLYQLLTEQAVDGVSLDQDRRWNALRQLAAFRYTGTAELLAQERQRDNSDHGQRRQLAVEVALSAATEKAGWRERALRLDENYRLSQSRIILQNLYPTPQRHELPTALWLEELRTLDQTRDQQFMRYLSAYLIPANCSQENASALARFLADNPALGVSLNNQLRKRAQWEQRCADVAELQRRSQQAG